MMPSEGEHSHESGSRAFDIACAVSMLFGRGGLARAVAGMAQLSADDVVVDVGCGPGTAVRRAHREGAAQCWGVDPSPTSLRIGRWVTAAKRIGGVSFLPGSAEQLPIESASATVIWAIQSVHHWANRDQGLRECKRVLAPGGRLFLMERAVTPGARGHAKHGLMADQADDVLGALGAAGFDAIDRRHVTIGRRPFVVITARCPGP
jgi:ubiquinone/menaquinone biosynthesis C-methylase UbiE